MRHTPIRDQEKRSYARAFAFCAGALACALWALVDDFFLRRSWKKYQTQLAWHDIETLAQQIAEDAAHQKLQVDLQAARGRLHDGDSAAQREALLRDIEAVRIRVAEADQELRFVKSELEEARYAYDAAPQHGHPTAKAEALIGELDARKTKIREELREAQADAGRLEGELGALGADVRRLEDTLLERRNAVDALYQKLDGITAFNLGVTLPVIGRVALRAPLVPHIRKLEKPRVYATRWIEQLMPNFALAETDILAIETFLASRTDARVPVRYHFADGGRSENVVAGRRVVARYNCTGCHIIEGTGRDVRRLFAGREALAPPNLRGEGGKVQSAWLFRFLKAPVSIRPWFHVRIPTFGLSDQETDRLVAYLDSLDRVEIPYVYLDVMKSPHEFLADGRTLTSPEYFNCFSCHQHGGAKARGPPPMAGRRTWPWLTNGSIPTG